MTGRPAAGSMQGCSGLESPHLGVHMPAITASLVAELRAKTDAPMMECKKALTEADGDLSRAEEILRVKLGNKAGKAASRITAEGVVGAAAVTGRLRPDRRGRAQGADRQDRREHVDPPLQALRRWRQAGALPARHAHR